MWLSVRGRGPDVVLVHGSLGDYRQWSAIGEQLEPNYRVIAVEPVVSLAEPTSAFRHQLYLRCAQRRSSIAPSREDFNTQHQAMIGRWERQIGDDFERKSVDATIAIMTQVGGNA